MLTFFEAQHAGDGATAWLEFHISRLLPRADACLSFSFASVTNTPGREFDFESSAEPRQEEPGTEMLDAAVPYVTSPYGNHAEFLTYPESEQMVDGQATRICVTRLMGVFLQTSELGRIPGARQGAVGRHFCK